MYRNFIKPLADTLVAFTLFLLFVPILLIVLVVLFFTNKGDFFFLQKRPGYQSKPFYIIKFKTMKDLFDEQGMPLADEYRLTKVGKFIRSWSIDELLQLINVIKGDMSLVGPRPLLMQYLDRYSERQSRRHEVKPGITGWAQVNGRNAISWEEKFELDVYYVEHQSLLMDLSILFKTVANVFARKGINEAGKVTMSEFLGTK